MYEIEIANGMRLLDEHIPGWEDKINLSRLDLCEPTFTVSRCGCVCAQLDHATYDHGTDEGYYADMARRLGLDPWGQEPIDYGFMGHEDDDGFEQLTAEWKAAIEARRAT